MNPFLDPEYYKNALSKGGDYFEGGARKFVDWSKKMVDEFGDAIKPYLLKLWADVQREKPYIEKVYKEEQNKDSVEEKIKGEKFNNLSDQKSVKYGKITFNLLIKIGSIVLLLIALLKLPYGYYTFLRLAITGASIYLAVLYYETDKKFFTYVFSIIAVLFNPLIPIYLSKSTWGVIDIVVAVFYMITIFNKRT